jgi:hypothetical protein
MISILILSKGDEGYGLARRLSKNCFVKYFSKDRRFEFLGKGFENPKTVKGFQEHLDTSDLVLVTDRGSFREYNLTNEKRKMVMGVGELEKAIEDVSFLKGLVRLMKVSTLPLEGPFFELSGWFNGTSWVSPFMLSQREDRFMEGNKGLPTECMGVITTFFSSGRIIDSVFNPLGVILKGFNYKGLVNLKVKFSEQQISLADFSLGFTFDNLEVFGECLKGPLDNFFVNILDGSLQEYNILGPLGLGVRLSTPPYPYEIDESQGWKEPISLNDGASNHLWIKNVYKHKDALYYGKVSGLLGCVTSWGSNYREASRRVYRTIKNIVSSPEVQYRLDIVQEFEQSLNLLKSWRWIDVPCN